MHSMLVFTLSPLWSQCFAYVYGLQVMWYDNLQILILSDLIPLKVGIVQMTLLSQNHWVSLGGQQLLCIQYRSQKQLHPIFVCAEFHLLMRRGSLLRSTAVSTWHSLHCIPEYHRQW